VPRWFDEVANGHVRSASLLFKCTGTIRFQLELEFWRCQLAKRVDNDDDNVSANAPSGAVLGRLCAEQLCGPSEAAPSDANLGFRRRRFPERPADTCHRNSELGTRASGPKGIFNRDPADVAGCRGLVDDRLRL
jgi:hypothetical protein